MQKAASKFILMTLDPLVNYWYQKSLLQVFISLHYYEVEAIMRILKNEEIIQDMSIKWKEKKYFENHMHIKC
jgi:hypothetical protein